MKNCGAYRGGILKQGGLQGPLKSRYSPLPSIDHCQSSNSLTSKTVAGLALFVSRFFSYLRTVLLSFSPHGPHGGQHIPGDR